VIVELDAELLGQALGVRRRAEPHAQDDEVELRSFTPSASVA
jgi:hypothetical protein